MKLTLFIGKQLSRFRIAQSYYSIITSTLSTLSLIIIAFNINVYFLIVLFPLILLSIVIIGYFLDVYNVNTMDIIKSNEIGQRFLNTRDLKIQEFHILQLKIIIKAIKDDSLDIDEYSKKLYDEYYKKWKIP